MSIEMLEHYLRWKNDDIHKFWVK